MSHHDLEGNWLWETPKFEHDARIDPSDPISFLPEQMRILLYQNKIKCSTVVCREHVDWIKHNVANPYFLGRDYIMFTDETDRTMFLSAH